MHNFNKQLHPVKRYAVPALKGTAFLGGLYILSGWLPSLLSMGIPERVSDWRYALLWVFLVLVSFVVTLFLFRSSFFSQVRQWLKPLWLPAVLIWLVPLTGLMAAAGLQGYYDYGFPFPGSPGDLSYPPGETVGDALFPLAAAMFCFIVVAHIVAGVLKRLPVAAVRLAVFLVFCCISLYATYVGTDYFKSGATWDDGEFLREVYLPYFHIAVFWLIPISVVAWRIIKEMFRPSTDGTVARGVLGKALLLAGLFLCCVLLVSYLVISWKIPSVTLLKSTEGVRSLLELDEKHSSMVILRPLDEMPLHVVNAATAFLRGQENSARQRLASYLLLSRKSGYTYLERDVARLNIMIFLSENELFSAWLAIEYFGKNTYGIGAAAETYYGKPLEELNLCEAAMLVPIPDSSWANPADSPDRAKERQQEVLDDMVKLGLVGEVERRSCR